MTTFLAPAYWQRFCAYLAQAQLQAELGAWYQQPHADTQQQSH